jgi:hypothetical protein
LPGYLAPPPVPALRQLAGYGRGLTSWRPGPEAPAVLIFAQGRSGSTLLVELLNSLPEVSCEGEILQRRVAFPAAWAEARRRRHRDELYGFKVKPLQLLHHQRVPDMGRWLARMQGRDWRLIHLERRNLLRQAVSNVAAERYGYGRRVGASEPVREPLHVDPAVLTHWMGVRARSREQEHAALPDCRTRRSATRTTSATPSASRPRSTAWRPCSAWSRQPQPRPCVPPTPDDWPTPSPTTRKSGGL